MSLKSLNGIANLNHDIEEFSKLIEQLIYHYTHQASLKTHGDNGLVIAIEGDYGIGKTTFLDFLTTKITQPDTYYADKTHGRADNQIYPYQKQDNGCTLDGIRYVLAMNPSSGRRVTVINYNAWENDYFDNPFLSLLGQVCKQCSIDKSLTKGFEESAKTIIGSLTQAGFIKILGEAAFQDIKKKLSKTSFSDELKLYSGLEKARVDFKENLSSLKNVDEEEPRIKLIIIDELDRCVPLYSIKFLETIKHFFNAKNTVFIIAFNKNQLAHSIKKVYGDTFDAEAYLSRFFDFELKLPHKDDFYNNLLSLQPPSIPDVAKMIARLFEFKPRELIKYLKLVDFAMTVQDWTRAEYFLMLALFMRNSNILPEMDEFISRTPYENPIKFFGDFVASCFPSNIRINQLKEEPKYKNIYAALWILLLMGSSKYGYNLVHSIKDHIIKENITPNLYDILLDKGKNTLQTAFDDLLAKASYFI